MKGPKTRASFWETLDSLLESGGVIIDRPKGSRHPRYPELVYPLDYGYVQGTMASDNSGIDVWKGSNRKKGISGILCTIDLRKNDAEIKILMDCTRAEQRIARDFHNTSTSMRAILIDRD
jgi:inorganic pyrophosphatase